MILNQNRNTKVIATWMLCVMCFLGDSLQILYCGQYANDGHIIAARWTAPLHYWSAGTVFVVLQRIPTKMT